MMPQTSGFRSFDVDQALDHPMVADAFPYRLYASIHDARTNKSHRALERYGLNGTAVYHKDDPTWLRFKPPWGPRHCRCGWIALSVKDAARGGAKEAIEWRDTGIEPAHQYVAPPPFSLDRLCEPGVLYICDYPLILDDLRSGDDSRMRQALKDFSTLVPCKREVRRLGDELATPVVLIKMAEALLEIDSRAIAAWPALVCCFVSHLVGRTPGEIVRWPDLLFEAMRTALNCGNAMDREQLLPVWLASNDAIAETLIQMLSCKHWDVRKAAAERLGQFGATAAAAIESLERLRDDRSKYVREAAVKAMLQICKR